MACDIKNGTDFAIYYDGDLIARGTSHDFEITMETRDASTKDSAGWKESCEAQRSWSMSGEFVFDTSAALDGNFDSLLANIDARDIVEISFNQTGPSDLWHGLAMVTSLSLSTPLEDTVTYSASFEGTGVLTHGQ